MNKREELIKLSQDKKISYSVAKLKKFSEEEIDRIYDDYLKDKQEKDLDELNESVTMMAISKLDYFLKRYSFIDENSKCGKRLEGRRLFVSDLKYFVSYVTPILPFIGLIDGGLIIAEEIYDSKCNSKNDDDSCKTEEGGEQDEDVSSNHDER